MAKNRGTFRKRQRENKLREKAQLKRERQQQRRNEKKESQAFIPQSSADEAKPTGPGGVAPDQEHSLEEGGNASEF